MSKKIIKISLVTIAFMALLACFRYTYAADLATTIIQGLAGVIVNMFQVFASLLFGALNLLIAAVTGVASGELVSLGDIIFNRCALTSANFFEVGTNNIKYGVAMSDIVTNVSTYYTVIRNLSIAILLGILIYVGIRMAISTVASDQAKYKKMLIDWAISLIIVFVLHFIIIIIFFINNQLVAVLEPLDPGDTFDMAALQAQSLVPGYGLDELIVYGVFTVAKAAFVIMYIKRTIVLGFLIVIAPLITITYAIDKMGDGKSQALNTWLREFVFTVIIQPFHCIIYIVFYGAAVKSAVALGDNNMGALIFGAATALFMLKAEGVIKKIFGIQPSSIGDAIGTGAMALTAATGLFGKGKGNKVDKSKGQMPNMEKNLDKNSKNTTKKDEKGATKDSNNSNANSSNNKNSGNTSSNDNSSTGNSSSTAGTTGSSDSMPSKQLSPEAVAALESSRKKKGFKDHVISGMKKVAWAPLGGEKSFKRNGGINGYLSRKISGAATLAGIIAGGAVGDVKSAISVGTAAGSMASNIYDNVEYKRAENKLDNNQRVFAGAYEDFAAAYRDEHGMDVDDEEIRIAAKHIYDGDGQNLTSQYQRDFYSNMQELSTSAEIMGYKNGYDYIDHTIRGVQDGVIEPHERYVHKNYNNKDFRNQFDYKNNGSNEKTNKEGK